jgi:RNA polymerase sigma-70 factor (ECF subfamily)
VTDPASTRTDEELALDSRAGNAAALAQLYLRHAPRLKAYLQRVLRSHDEAEDILQDTFVRLFEGRGTYTPRGRFRSWLYTIATRQALDRLRNENRRSELLVQHAHTITPLRDPLQRVADQQLLSRIDAVLATLPAEMVTAFHLRMREEFRYAEIAAICGTSEGTLRSRIHHTLKKIHQALGVSRVEHRHERKQESS